MGHRFLIVDDSELVRRSLRTVLKGKIAWDVCAEASDGATAIEMVRDMQPDLVIVDFQMPGMNGIDTARRIFEISPGLPIILFTQHAGKDLEQHAQEVGIHSVLSKSNPFPMIGMIEALLARRDSEPNDGGQGIRREPVKRNPE